MIDGAEIRKDFPALQQEVHGRPLVYLDSAATSQRPRVVIETVRRFYQEDNASVHRAIHTLGERATAAYEGGREKVARFLKAPDPRGVVFTKNCTEAINLVAHGWARRFLREGDEILTTPMEHHSNLVPWQLAARATGARLRFLELTPDGRLDLASLERLLGKRTRLVAVTHTSNVLGTVNPVAEIARAARAVGAAVLVDGAQSTPHMDVDVEALGCDWFAFSAHKMCGPMGVGVLYGRPERLEEMDPFLGGGSMIRSVSLERSEWNELPHKFEAGTPNVAGVIGLGAAVDYLTGLGMDEVQRYEEGLVAYALARLQALPDVTLYGPTQGRASVVTFNVDGIHPHDLATILDQEGVAIRAGHHCAQPLMRLLGVTATARASLYIYNTREDVDRLVYALGQARELFGHVLG